MDGIPTHTMFINIDLTDTEIMAWCEQIDKLTGYNDFKEVIDTLDVGTIVTKQMVIQWAREVGAAVDDVIYALKQVNPKCGDIAESRAREILINRLSRSMDYNLSNNTSPRPQSTLGTPRPNLVVPHGPIEAKFFQGVVVNGMDFENFKKELALVTKCPGYEYSADLAAAMVLGLSRQEPLSNFVAALKNCRLNHCAEVVCEQASKP